MQHRWNKEACNIFFGIGLWLFWNIYISPYFEILLVAQKICAYFEILLVAQKYAQYLNNCYEYFCMTTISRYKYIAFFIYVTDKSCIHTFTSKYCWKYFVTDILSWQIAFTDISRLLFMLQINRVYILLQQKIDKIHAKPAT